MRTMPSSELNCQFENALKRPLTTYKLQWLRLESIQQSLAGMWETLKQARIRFYRLIRPKFSFLPPDLTSCLALKSSETHHPYGET